MSTLEVIGWIGSLAFAFCALPQAYHSWKTGKSDGVTWGLIIGWWIGEWCSLIYVLPTFQWPLIANYVGNIIFCGVITYYKIWERKDNGR